MRKSTINTPSASLEMDLHRIVNLAASNMAACVSTFEGIDLPFFRS